MSSVSIWSHWTVERTKPHEPPSRRNRTVSIPSTYKNWSLHREKLAENRIPENRVQPYSNRISVKGVLEATTGMFTFFVLLCVCVCVCSVCFVCFSYWSLSPLTPAGVPVVWRCLLRCVRALNFVHYIHCVKFFYARRLRTLRELLQKPLYVVAVVEFCVYLIHLSLWYCKSRQLSFVRFLVLYFSWSQKVVLCFIGLLFSLCGGVAAGVQTVNCDHAWSRFSGVSYGTLTHSSHCVER